MFENVNHMSQPLLLKFPFLSRFPTSEGHASLAILFVKRNDLFGDGENVTRDPPHQWRLYVTKPNELLGFPFLRRFPTSERCLTA